MNALMSHSLMSLRERLAHRRIAIVHDWLVVQGGAEKVLDALLQAIPQADIFTLVDFMPLDQRGRLSEHRVNTSIIQRLPFARRYFRHYLPLMPFAIEQFDLHGYDLVISSSHAIAKGVITHPGQLHVCYCHTPMRYAWDMKEKYLANARLPKPLLWYLRRTLKRMRQWDCFNSAQVDLFIANSHNVAGRIAKYYRREAVVIQPPINLQRFHYCPGPREDHYLAASRLVHYKRIDLIIEAFKRSPERRLKVIGDGPELKRLERQAAGYTNIELLGYQPDDVLQKELGRARGFVFAADEDFGMLPLEAQACGTPVIAYGSGGALETVRGNADDSAPTGCFFKEQSVESLLDALACFEESRISSRDCRAHAQCFDHSTFWERWDTQLKQLNIHSASEVG